MHPSLVEQGHRPYPIPEIEWHWRQSWCELLFAHWPVDAEKLRSWIPRPLEIDTFEGQAWLGVVPFQMKGVMRRPFCDVPGISAFDELNVRTYVRLNGRPGVWFHSLDANNRLAIWGARRWFGLPYERAKMKVDIGEREIKFDSVRQGKAPPAELKCRYRAISDPYLSTPGTLEHWLTERYCLYSFNQGKLLRGEIHHVQWPLQKAEADFEVNTMGEQLGFRLTTPPSHLHFAKRVDVVVWNPFYLD